MFNIINSINDPLLSYIKDDPVRPEIPLEFRVSTFRFVGALVEDKPQAMVCVSLHDFIPKTVEELKCDTEKPEVAIFYTIWSYKAGAAAELLFETVKQIKEMFPSITRFVTLSPKTKMAERFHLRNGAKILQENETTVNYEYLVS